jgi:F-type H+-transporting ATPase subunit epsilon
MRLLITTPTTVVIDDRNVVAVRAEDDSGSFGILDGHADFLTALTVSVVSWRRGPPDDGRRFCAVRRGVLSVANGSEVAIATREAITGDDFDHLDQVVLSKFRDALEAERTARTESLQLQMKAIRQIVHYLRPERPGASRGGP